jgi:hypothetical protein
MKTMKKEDVLALLEGQEDLLTPMVDEQKKRCEAVTCPVCGGACITAPHPTTPFVPSSPLPNRVSKCVVCEALICPDTKLILRAGRFSLINPLS